MSGKRIMSICIDDDLIEIVNELKSRREFSKFIQDCLRSHQTVIKAESLENEKSTIAKEIEKLNSRIIMIDNELSSVATKAKEEKDILALEKELRRLNSMKPDVEHWENIPITKRPKLWHEWNNKRNAVAKSLKEAGFDFSKLREVNNSN